MSFVLCGELAFTVEILSVKLVPFVAIFRNSGASRTYAYDNGYNALSFIRLGFTKNM